MIFSLQWTKSFWSRSQKLLDVGVKVKNLRCLEIEPESEIWCPAPQPWYFFFSSLLYFLQLSIMRFICLLHYYVKTVYEYNRNSIILCWIIYFACALVYSMLCNIVKYYASLCVGAVWYFSSMGMPLYIHWLFLISKTKEILCDRSSDVICSKYLEFPEPSKVGPVRRF